MGIKSILLKNSIEREVWTLALRKRSAVSLYKGNAEGFEPLKKNARYWFADPFIFKHKGINYLFAEMFDRKKNKGVIGVAKIKNGKIGKFRVCLDLKYHLSYPCVYEKNGEIFMLPECFESGKVIVYKAEKFPYKWKPCHTLFEGKYVDTTPLFLKESGKEIYFTSWCGEENCGNDNLCVFDGENLKTVAENDFRVRSAGNLFYDGGLIRPAQDDTETYGCGLFFYGVESVSGDFKETEIMRVCIKGNKEKDGDLELPLGENYIGIHTYNFNEDYEVIDLLVKEQENPIVLWHNRKKVIDSIIKKIKRKVGRK